ncbi:putative transcriptional regulator, LysR family protein [Roseibium sp. TrichSKD4]|uniref:LysR family transcriptional regulator n=1 Tax=Roseibium sp. TrichSKD4 TaxID=744980 RepID=UPI0001E56E56|nr:LysR family transcriptional regulator [Roseibium sp. TrichSKD4]EFO32159.1 putative transcriptional regulator, LysR family protein [Roseibium sp. TrichSKD4]
MTSDPLPPVLAIRAFEAVSRHLSFTKAGEELGMTQAAVSYQIKVLEERLGFPVFVRRARKIDLTEKGTQLATRVVDAFRDLRTAFSDVRQENDTQLVIACNPTFASRWLAAHLFDFQIANPDLAIRIIPSDSEDQYKNGEQDITISGCYAPPPDNIRHPLIPATFSPMLHPDLAASIGGINSPTDLLKLPITDPADHWWPLWFAKAGIPNPDLGSWPSSRMGSQGLEADRAIAGKGVAILTPFFYRAELASGQLIQPFDLVEHDPGMAWHLSYPHSNRNSRKVRLFRDWIFTELLKDGLDMEETGLAVA